MNEATIRGQLLMNVNKEQLFKKNHEEEEEKARMIIMNERARK